ncbi:MAG: cytochrome c [Candidatus Eisenbacteria bacterium]|nr:cytochrome c [Candidatus Eisenbacteria bacterium]
MKPRFGAWLLALGVAVSGLTAPQPVSGAEVDSTAAEVVREDPGARRYVTACSGCHRLEGAKLNGPALSHVVTWPQEQLRAAIKRMEKNVGPLSEADLTGLTEFLQSTEAKSRLAVQEERIRAQFAKSLAPADARIGGRIFRGEQRLENGGLACAACHRFGGTGGGLGPDLTDAAVRLGKTPLASGIAGAGYKVMAPHYRLHPITAQEASHLAEFLAAPVSPPTRTSAPPLFALAGGGAALAFAGLAAYFARGRRRRGSVRTGREG